MRMAICYQGLISGHADWDINLQLKIIGVLNLAMDNSPFYLENAENKSPASMPWWHSSSSDGFRRGCGRFGVWVSGGIKKMLPTKTKTIMLFAVAICIFITFSQ